MDSNTTLGSYIKFGIVSKAMISILLVFYTLSFLNANFSLIYSNIPLFTMFWSELWRFFTGPFISENFLSLFINVSAVSLILNYFENLEGTMKTIKNFVIHIVLIQLLYLVIHIVFIIAFNINQVYKIKSLLPLNLAYLLQLIFLSENKYLITFQNIKINNRLLFAFLTVFFVFLNFSSFLIEIIGAIYYGFLISKYKNGIVILADETILQVESSEDFKSLLSWDGYIALEEAQKFGNQFNSISQTDDLESNTNLKEKKTEVNKKFSENQKQTKRGK